MRKLFDFARHTALIPFAVAGLTQDTVSHSTQQKAFEITLNPGEQEKIIPFWIDKSWEIGHYASYLTKIKYKIEDPDGNVKDHTNHWDLSEETNGFGGRNLKPGIWKLHLEPIQPLKTPVKVSFFQIFTGPIINAFVVTQGASARPGERVPIMVTTADTSHDNQPVKGITIIKAEIVVPKSFSFFSVKRQSLNLTDDGSEPGGVIGDGVWGCWFTPEREGWYSVSISIEGPTPDGGRFQRDCLGNFQVKKSSSK